MVEATNDAFGLLSGQLGFRTIAEMVDALPPATLESILRYHMLPGSITGPDLLAGDDSLTTSLVQDGTTLTDVPNDNGVFHVVDRVLLPPELLTVLQTVQSNPERFQGLVNNINPALTTALNDPTASYTLFAPVNAAFEAAETVLLPLAPNQIEAALRYHVLGTRVLSSEITFGTPLATLLVR
mgnify:CR=1 FL=1